MKIRIALAAVALFTCSASANAQNVLFTKTLLCQGQVAPYESASCRDANGNYYVSGISEGSLLTEKMDDLGNVIWRHVSAPPTNTVFWLVGFAPAELILPGDDNGDVYVIENAAPLPFTFQSGAPNDLLVEHLTSGGSTMWRANLGNVVCVGALMSPGGDLVIGTDTRGTTQVFTIAKHSHANGATIWQKSIALNSGASEATQSIFALAGKNGFYYAANISDVNSPMLTRFSDANGSIVWSAKHPSGQGVLQGLCLVTAQGDVLVSAVNNSGATDAGFFDTFGAANGTLAAKPFARPLQLSSFAPDGNVYYVDSDNGEVGKATSSGDPIWEQSDGVSVNPLTLPNQTQAPNGPNVGANGDELVFMSPLASPYDWTFLNPGAFTRIGGESGNVNWSVPPTPAIAMGPGNPALYLDESGNASAVYPLLDSLLNPYLGFVSYNSDGSVKATAKDAPTGTVSTAPQEATSDPSGNMYTLDKEGFNVAVSKYSPSGALLWRTTVAPQDLSWRGAMPVQVLYAPYGDVVIAAGRDTAWKPVHLAFVDGFNIAKLDAVTGSVKWTQTIRSSRLAGQYYAYANGITANPTYEPSQYAQGVVEFSNGDVGVAFNNLNPQASVQNCIRRMASRDGSQVWQYTIAPSRDTPVVQLGGIALSPDGGIVAFGGHQSTTSGLNDDVIKLDGGGHLVSQVSAADPLHSMNLAGPGTIGIWSNQGNVDSNGSAYELTVATVSYGSPTGYAIMRKYDSSGTLLWSRALPNSPIGSYSNAIFSESSDALYVITWSSAAETSPTANCVAAVDPQTGRIRWSKIFSAYGLHYGVPRALLDQYGNLLFAQAISPSNWQLSSLNYADGQTDWSYNYGDSLTLTHALALTSGNAPVVFGSEGILQDFTMLSGFMTKLNNALPNTVCVNVQFSGTADSSVNVAAPGVLQSSNSSGWQAQVVQWPKHAYRFKLQASGAFQYIPFRGFKGSDSFRFRAVKQDGTVSNPATANITIG